MPLIEKIRCLITVTYQVKLKVRWSEKNCPCFKQLYEALVDCVK